MKPPVPRVGLSLMTEEAFLVAARPLFTGGEVEVLEWTFDVGWGESTPAGWVDELVDFYAGQGGLLGHGVSYSLLSADNHEHQSRWLSCLEQELRLRQYLRISEHFGWMMAGAFQQSAPLPLPLTERSLAVGVANMRSLAERARCPVGLENLAFAFGLRDVQEQGSFLEELLAPVDGFLVLDLHNLYCQMHNFGKSAPELLGTYPLDRVKELHLSGGSWSAAAVGRDTSPIRRDTHDGAVPEEVFDLLREALKRCSNVTAVILEQLGPSLNQEKDAEQFRADFRRIRQTVKGERA